MIRPAGAAWLDRPRLWQRTAPADPPARPGGHTPLIWYEGAAQASKLRRFLHTDPRGSIIALADCFGNQQATNSYDEYGIPDTATGSDPGSGPGSGIATKGRFRYTGQAWIPELGMYYYKARIYSPTLGRFLQTDPIGYSDGMNTYAYVGNDPVNRIDPTGLCLTEVTQLYSGPEGKRRLVEQTEKPLPCIGERFKKIRSPMDSLLDFHNQSPYKYTPREASTAKLPQSGKTSSICARRDWHNLKVSEQVPALREAGFQVATNVALRLIAPDGTGWNGPSYAVADYLVKIPGENVVSFRIGELKTGDAQLTMRQIQHYGTGFAQLRSDNASAFGVWRGDIIPVIYTGEDRAPSCPVGGR